MNSWQLGLSVDKENEKLGLSSVIVPPILHMPHHRNRRWGD